jgi:GGDEF domain-containing protein
MAETVRGTLAHEQTDARSVQEAIGRLQRAADIGSVQHVHQEVRRATQELLALATHRDSRYKELAARVGELSEQVQALTTQLHQAQQASETDALTGLLNRAGFEAALRRALARYAATGGPMTLALVDLNDLKWVNDRHGHMTGYAAIRAVGDSLRTACRASDVLARIGGEG